MAAPEPPVVDAGVIFQYAKPEELDQVQPRETSPSTGKRKTPFSILTMQECPSRISKIALCEPSPSGLELLHRGSEGRAHLDGEFHGDH